MSSNSRDVHPENRATHLFSKSNPHQYYVPLITHIAHMRK